MLREVPFWVVLGLILGLILGLPRGSFLGLPRGSFWVPLRVGFEGCLSGGFGAAWWFEI